MNGLAASEALKGAFRLIAEETPEAFEWLARELRGLRIRCTVDDEAFIVLGGDRPRIVPGGGEGRLDADVRASKPAVLDLIDGEVDMLGAIRQRRLSLTADIRLMVRLSRAQRAFAEGAVRARGARDLLRRYRGPGPGSTTRGGG
jgi:hypothetical protein